MTTQQLKSAIELLQRKINSDPYSADEYHTAIKVLREKLDGMSHNMAGYKNEIGKGEY